MRPRALEWQKGSPTRSANCVSSSTKELCTVDSPRHSRKTSPSAGKWRRRLRVCSEKPNALFDGAIKGYCTSPGCFNKKTAAFYKEIQATAAAWVEVSGRRSITATPPAQQLKGAFVVEKVDEKIKKAMQAKPRPVRVSGVVKPSRWGGKKPRVVLLVQGSKIGGTRRNRRPRLPIGSLLRPKNANGRSSFAGTWKPHTTGLALEKLEFDKTDLLGASAGRMGQRMAVAARSCRSWKRQDVSMHQDFGASPPFPTRRWRKKSRDTLIQVVFFSLLELTVDQLVALLEHKKAKVQES